ncbi:unnamed protein product [Urochloa decumbens]|uniref:Cytochrome b561 and DOMON domain-containing protein n=1 Tax=Urochloa decumbens TaxID=240449 RepID=A0ABC8ZEV0_9POAL
MARATRASEKHSMAQQCTPRSLPGLMVLCFVGLHLPSLSAAADSCSNGLSLGSLVPFNTTGLACFQAWPSQDFILRFGKASASGSNEVWSFVLSAPDNGGYISMGFSPTGRMVGSSAVAGWAGAGSARQYYLGGTSPSSCPPDQGDLALTRGAAVVVSKGSRLYLAFQLAGQQPLTDVIYAVGPSGTLPGSNGLLPRHQDMASGTVSLSGGGGGSPATGGGGDGDGDGKEGGEGNKGKSERAGEGSGGDDDEGGERRTSTASASSSGGGGALFLTSKRRHGVLALISWGVLVPVGVALARFFKHFDPFWFYAHVAAQGLGIVLGTVAVVAGFKLDGGGDVAAHKAIGVAVVVGAGLQAMALLARPAVETKPRRYWNWYHHGVGRVAVALGVANVFYGFSLANERQEWSYVYGVFVGIFAVVYLVLEEWRRTH